MVVPEPPVSKKLPKLVIVLIAIVVILAGGLAYTAALLSSGTGTGPMVTYNIGLAIAISGSTYTGEGGIRRDGALLAIDQMNAALAARGWNVRFNPVHEDTTGAADKADTVVRGFVTAGIQVIVGPLSSGETSQVRQFVTDNKIVVISPSATALSLALPDYVFRMAPTDDFQAKALAKLINATGFEKVAIIARQDDYGRGLSTLFQQEFTTRYGGQASEILYTTAMGADLSAEVLQLDQNVLNFGADSKTAVLAISFSGDGLEVFDEARNRANLPLVRWFASESVKRSIFINPASASAAIRDFTSNATQLTGFFPSPANNTAAAEFRNTYIARFGKDPSSSPYAFYAYDAAWLAMASVLAAGKYNGEAIAKWLPIVAKEYFGVSGNKELNANGDPLGADYSAWKLVYDSTTSSHKFRDIGAWHFLTGELEFY
jgi:branched-chain amino acid transport system substrate-binding protein